MRSERDRKIEEAARAYVVAVVARRGNPAERSRLKVNKRFDALCQALALPDQVSEPVTSAQTDTQDDPEQVARRAAEFGYTRGALDVLKRFRELPVDVSSVTECFLHDAQVHALRRGEVKS